MTNKFLNKVIFILILLVVSLSCITMGNSQGRRKFPKSYLSMKRNTMEPDRLEEMAKRILANKNKQAIVDRSETNLTD